MSKEELKNWKKELENLTADDLRIFKQALLLVRKMTPDERKDFYKMIEAD